MPAELPRYPTPPEPAGRTRARIIQSRAHLLADLRALARARASKAGVKQQAELVGICLAGLDELHELDPTLWALV